MNTWEGQQGFFHLGGSWVLGWVDTAVHLVELREATHTFSLKMFQPPIHSLYSRTPHIGFLTITDQLCLSVLNYDGNGGLTHHPSCVFPIVMPPVQAAEHVGDGVCQGGLFEAFSIVVGAFHQERQLSFKCTLIFAVSVPFPGS